MDLSDKNAIGSSNIDSPYATRHANATYLHPKSNFLRVRHSVPRQRIGITERQQTRLHPDSYAALLRLCIVQNSLHKGMIVHDSLTQHGLDEDRYLGNILVEMYDKCEALEEAFFVFEYLENRNVFTWNNIIVAHTRRGHDMQALSLFHRMELTVVPNEYTFNLVLGSCANLKAFSKGQLAHSSAVKVGLDSTVLIGSALINMYAKCGKVNEAGSVFNSLSERNVVTYTSMITAYLQESRNKDAFRLFKCIVDTGIAVDEYCFTTMLGACSAVGALDDGRFIHRQVINYGFETNANIGAALISMYARCFDYENSLITFNKAVVRNTALYTSLISTFVQFGNSEEAFKLFKEMLQENIEPNEATFVSILSACADPTFSIEGKIIYHMIVEIGFVTRFMVASAIVNMFGKCGSPEDAHLVFDKMYQCPSMVWNSLISAYVTQGKGKEALELYKQMDTEGLAQTEITFISVLSACGICTSLPNGKSIHASVVKHGFESKPEIGNALISLYGKCGSLADAVSIFHSMPQHDVVSWNSIIAAYIQNGHYDEAFQLFGEMCKQGVKPNEITFVAILSACSHSGFVLKGLQYFLSMKNDFGIEPTIKHYGCIVDILARAGQLENALDIFRKIPELPDSVAWKSFLSACSFHGSRSKGHHIADSVFDSNVKEAPMFVLLSNILTSG